MTITLPEDLTRAIERVAAKNGLTVSELLEDLVRSRLVQELPDSDDSTLLDALRPYVGIVDGPPISISKNSGSQFTAALLKAKERPA